MEKYHDLYTDDSKTFIKLEELKETIKNLPIDEQNKIKESVLSISEIINGNYKKEIKNYEILDKKRQVIIKTSNKELLSNNDKSAAKKNINNKILDYNLEINKILSLTLEELKHYVEDLYNNNSLSQETIIYLMLGINKELISYREILDLEKNIDEINAIKEEITLLSAKKDYLESYKNKFKNTNNKEQKEIKLIFFETSSERAYFIEDIKDDIDFYESYNKLLNSIKENNPLNRRSFTDDETVNGLLEVRDLSGQTRIIYDQINLDTCIIIFALIKKVDKNSIYKSQVVSRYKIYLDNKNRILDSLNNEDFIERQVKYKKEIDEMFNNKDNRLVLKKGDDNE